MMTAAERRVMNEIHETVIQLKTIIIGNGIKGMAAQVADNTNYIHGIKEDHDKVVRHDKLYYKAVGALLAFSVITNIILFLFK